MTTATFGATEGSQDLDDTQCDRDVRREEGDPEDGVVSRRARQSYQDCDHILGILSAMESRRTSTTSASEEEPTARGSNTQIPENPVLPTAALPTQTPSNPTPSNPTPSNPTPPTASTPREGRRGSKRTKPTGKQKETKRRRKGPASIQEGGAGEEQEEKGADREENYEVSEPSMLVTMDAPSITTDCKKGYFLARRLLSIESFQRLGTLLSIHRNCIEDRALHVSNADTWLRKAEVLHLSMERAGYIETTLSQLKKLYCGYELAVVMRERQEKLKLVSNKVEDVMALMNRLNIPHTGQTNDPAFKKFQETLNHWEKVRKLCGQYGKGLIALLPVKLPGTTTKGLQLCTLHRYQRTKLEQFSQSLSPHQNVMLQLSRCGEAMIKLLFEGAEFEFNIEIGDDWKSTMIHDAVEYRLHCEDPLEAGLKSFTMAKYPLQNTVNTDREEDYGAAPSGWHEGLRWPQDLNLAGPGTTCACCGQEDQCTCITDIPEGTHAIASYGSKGRGIKARRDLDSNTYIGELIGEIHPVGGDENNQDWGIDLFMPNSPDPIAWLSTMHHGSWTRLINTSCQPNCEFKTGYFSGQLRVMIRTIKDIKSGEEITAGYGENYLEGRQCLCNGKPHFRPWNTDEGDDGEHE